MNTSSSLILFILLSLYYFTNCDAYGDLIDLDEYTDYSAISPPSLPVNTTKGESIEFNEAVSFTEPINLPSSIKETIISKALFSEEIKENFIEFILGFFTAWLRSASSLRNIMHSPSFNQGECNINNLFNEYTKSVSDKQNEIQKIVFEYLGENIPQKEKIAKCSENVNKQKEEIQEQIEIRNEIITSHKKQIEEYKRKKDYDSVNAITEMVIQHEKAISDLNRDLSQISKINCDSISKDNNTNIQLGIITIASYIKTFLQKSISCIEKSTTGKTLNLISRVSMDVAAFLKAGQIESLFQVFTFGFFSVLKAIYHVYILSYSIMNLMKAYKGKKWDEFAFNLGKSIGSSIRVVLCVTLGKR